jgi:hypothetical protein
MELLSQSGKQPQEESRTRALSDVSSEDRPKHAQDWAMAAAAMASRPGGGDDQDRHCSSCTCHEKPQKPSASSQL